MNDTTPFELIDENLENNQYFKCEYPMDRNGSPLYWAFYVQMVPTMCGQDVIDAFFQNLSQPVDDTFQRLNDLTTEPSKHRSLAAYLLKTYRLLDVDVCDGIDDFASVFTNAIETIYGENDGVAIPVSNPVWETTVSNVPSAPRSLAILGLFIDAFSPENIEATLYGQLPSPRLFRNPSMPNAVDNRAKKKVYADKVTSLTEISKICDAVFNEGKHDPDPHTISIIVEDLNNKTMDKPKLPEWAITKPERVHIEPKPRKSTAKDLSKIDNTKSIAEPQPTEPPAPEAKPHVAESPVKESESHIEESPAPGQQPGDVPTSRTKRQASELRVPAVKQTPTISSGASEVPKSPASIVIDDAHEPETTKPDVRAASNAQSEPDQRSAKPPIIVPEQQPTDSPAPSQEQQPTDSPAPSQEQQPTDSPTPSQEQQPAESPTPVPESQPVEQPEEQAKHANAIKPANKPAIATNTEPITTQGTLEISETPADVVISDETAPGVQEVAEEQDVPAAAPSTETETSVSQSDGNDNLDGIVIDEPADEDIAAEEPHEDIPDEEPSDDGAPSSIDDTENVVPTARHAAPARQAPIPQAVLNEIYNHASSREQIADALHLVEHDIEDNTPNAQFLSQFVPGVTQEIIRDILVNRTASGRYISRSAGRTGNAIPHTNLTDGYTYTADTRTRALGPVEVPPGFAQENSSVLWDEPVITTMGYPFINFGAPEIRTILHDKDEARVKQAYKRLKKQMKKVGLSEPIKVLKDFKNSVGVACAINRLSVDAEDLLESGNATVNATVYPRATSTLQAPVGSIQLTRDFIVEMYKVLSPTKGARIYMDTLGMDEDEYADTLNTEGHPPIYIFIPKDNLGFKKAPAGFIARLLTGNSKPTLVEAKIGTHPGGFVMPFKTTRILFTEV